MSAISSITYTKFQTELLQAAETAQQSVKNVSQALKAFCKNSPKMVQRGMFPGCSVEVKNPQYELALQELKTLKERHTLFQKCIREAFKIPVISKESIVDASADRVFDALKIYSPKFKKVSEEEVTNHENLLSLSKQAVPSLSEFTRTQLAFYRVFPGAYQQKLLHAAEVSTARYEDALYLCDWLLREISEETSRSYGPGLSSKEENPQYRLVADKKRRLESHYKHLQASVRIAFTIPPEKVEGVVEQVFSLLQVSEMLSAASEKETSKTLEFKACIDRIDHAIPQLEEVVSTQLAAIAAASRNQA